MAEYAEGWPYSTLNGVLGLSRLNIPLEPDTIMFNPDFDSRELDWLNQMPSTESLTAFRKALQKRQFKPPSLRQKEKRHELEYKKL